MCTQSGIGARARTCKHTSPMMLMMMMMMIIEESGDGMDGAMSTGRSRKRDDAICSMTSSSVIERAEYCCYRFGIYVCVYFIVEFMLFI